MFTVLCFKCTPVYVKIEIFLDKVQSRFLSVLRMVHYPFILYILNDINCQ